MAAAAPAALPRPASANSRSYISADNRILDLDRERIDLAVRYCPETMAPPGAHRLFGERLQPVCSPALAADRARPLKRPEDLARHVLLHIDDDRGRFPWLNWGQWFAAIGMAETAGAGAMRFNQFDLLIQAALDGQGVALGRSPLVDRLLEQRQLVAPFHKTHATTRAYFIVRSAASAKRPEAQAVVDWLAAAAEESNADATAGDRTVAQAPADERPARRRPGSFASRRSLPAAPACSTSPPGMAGMPCSSPRAGRACSPPIAIPAALASLAATPGHRDPRGRS